MTTDITFDGRIWIAGQLVARARMFFDVWWLYEGAETRPAILDAMNEYPEFFRYDSHAHFVALIVHLAALLEPRSDTVNVGALIGEAAAVGVSPETIAAVQVTLARLDRVRPKLMILRNNLFAHRSASLSYADAFSKASLAPNDLREATESILSLVNTLQRDRGLPQQGFNDLPGRDMRKLLDAITRRQLV